MKKGDLTNIWLMISVLMMLIVFAFLWMAQQSAQSVVNPTIEEVPVITGIALMRRKQ